MSGATKRESAALPWHEDLHSQRAIRIRHRVEVTAESNDDSTDNWNIAVSSTMAR
jgi:hypothetical protein